MPQPFIDITGDRFGRYRVISRAENTKQGSVRWNCLCDCGAERIVPSSYLRSGTSSSCGCYRREIHSLKRREQTGNKHPAWKGGRYTRNGYIVLRGRDIETTTGDHSIYEHVCIMETHLNRKLLPGENVHHLNGIRHDNRIENLELWNKPQPTGCRINDQVEWATEILQRYAPERLIV